MNIDDSVRLNIISNGTLKTTHEECNQPDDISITLNCYQLQTINAMMKLENESSIYDDDNYIKSSYGILCNKSGSGKSLCILGLISVNRDLLLKDKIIKMYTENLSIVSRFTNKMNIKSNLIVASYHLLYTVWASYIKNYTNLTYCFIDTSLNINDMSNYDCVLCTEKYYNDIMKKTKHILWNRIIFDEADSICIPGCKTPQAKFIWFVTSSIKNLLFPNGFYWKHNINSISRVIIDGIKHQGWIRKIFTSLEKCNDENILKYIFIKIPDEYIDEIISLPYLQSYQYDC